MSKNDFYLSEIELPPPAMRTAQEWVNFYLECEAAIAEGKVVRFDDGRFWEMEDLDKISKLRREWEARAVNQRVSRQSEVGRFGGLRYRTPDLTQ